MRTYRDSVGNPCPLERLVREEPAWAVNQILDRDAKEAQLRAIQTYLSDGAGQPFHDGTLLEQVMAAHREQAAERMELELLVSALRAERDAAIQKTIRAKLIIQGLVGYSHEHRAECDYVGSGCTCGLISTLRTAEKFLTDSP